MSNSILTSGETSARTVARPRGPVWLRFVLGVIGFIAAMLLGQLTWSIPPFAGLARWATENGASDPSRAVLVTVAQFLTMTLAAVLVVWLLMRFVDRRPLRESGLRVTASSPLWLLLGMGVSAVILLGIGMPLEAAGLLREAPTEPIALPAALVVLIGLGKAFLLQGFPEELFFRGYLLQVLRSRPITAVLVSSAVFGALHIISHGNQANLVERFIYLIPPTGFAITAGALVLLTKSLWAAVGIHGGFHVANYLGSSWGMGDGAVFNAAVGIGFVAVGLVLLGVWHRRRGPDEHVSLVR